MGHGADAEIAKRLAAAVPNVLDCDRLGVWLWDPLRRELRPAASWGQTAEQEAFISDLTLSPDRMPALRALSEGRQPLFFELGTDDEDVAELMFVLEVVAMAVVPIAREALLGALMVSVTERPERLRLQENSLERLTGVAALAATGLQSGQLIDKLQRRAQHDALTGLLNRAGFREYIDALLERSAPVGHHVGLLFVALDNYKLVSDSYGHEAGDEVIRKAAARLQSLTRASDAVARLDGDEFAIVLAEVERESQVRAAEARVRMAFIEPFYVGEQQISIGASVGGGMWPDHGRTVSELVRHADAAMYADKPRGSKRSPPV